MLYKMFMSFKDVGIVSVAVEYVLSLNKKVKI